ncbi:hypothetical protein Tco_0884596 [Tanacetum coccineum]
MLMIPSCDMSMLTLRMCFFIDGSGGTGTTFLYKALLAIVHSHSLIGLAIAFDINMMMVGDPSVMDVASLTRFFWDRFDPCRYYICKPDQDPVISGQEPKISGQTPAKIQSDQSNTATSSQTWQRPGQTRPYPVRPGHIQSDPVRPG